MPVDRRGGDCQNIVWLLVDSIRRYPGGDFRGKLPFMERFAREAVEFETVVTTAPSTIMSITAMMSGLPAYFLARNYDQFRFDGAHRPSLPRILKERGYTCWAFLRGTETREKFGTFLDPVPRKYWPGDLKHGDKWRNQDLNRLLERVLEVGIPRPAFLFFHFNPRTHVETDPRVSDKVEIVYLRLREAGFDDENTIWVVCSDHGYPDPRTGISAEWEVTTGLSHDLVLTDDNILIPLSIRYPGCRPRKVETAVSSLDLFPTLLELAGVPGEPEMGQEIDGRSLVPLMDSGGDRGYRSRYFRCDSRLMLQKGRATAIRSRDFKYVRFHDQYRVSAAGAPEAGSEVLVDLRADPEEERNLLADGHPRSEIRTVLDRHRSEFERSEARGVEFQVQHLLARQEDILKSAVSSRADPEEVTALVAFEPDTAGYVEIGIRAIGRALPNARLDVLADSRNLPEAALPREIGQVFHYCRQGRGLEVSDLKSARVGGYDLALVFVQDPKSSLARQLLRVTKKTAARRRLVVDCNFNVYRPERFWYYRMRTLVGRLSHVPAEPQILLGQGRALAGMLKKRFLQALGRWERWDELETGQIEE